MGDAVERDHVEGYWIGRAHLEAELTRLRDANAALERERDEALVEMNDAHDSVEALLERIEERTDANATLEDQCTEAAGWLKLCKQQLETLQTELGEARSDILDLRNDRSCCVEAVREMRERVAKILHAKGRTMAARAVRAIKDEAPE